MVWLDERGEHHCASVDHRVVGLHFRVEGEGIEGESTGLLPNVLVDEFVVVLLHGDAIDEALAPRLHSEGRGRVSNRVSVEKREVEGVREGGGRLSRDGRRGKWVGVWARNTNLCPLIVHRDTPHRLGSTLASSGI